VFWTKRKGLNMFFNPKGSDRSELPSKVYVRADTEHSEDGKVLLEAADSRWIDDKRKFSFGGLDDMALSIIEIRLLPREWNAIRESARWLALGLGDKPRPKKKIIKHYSNLFSDGIMRYLETIEAVHGPMGDKLDMIVDTSDIPDGDPSFIKNLIPKTLDAVGVYDVGQGNCNSLLRRNAPTLYFDFGGGVLQNASTFPDSLHSFCFTYHPPIVLSHWDWDHWSSAYRDTRAFDQYWIAPRQEFGVIHAACAKKIGERLLFWPHATTALDNGNIRIEKCTSKGSDRNHTGLAMAVSNNDHTILLPGDARYTAIPRGKKGNKEILSVVATHHGGKKGSKYVPMTTGAPESRVVYSCGHLNSYNHPLWTEMQLYIDAGWVRTLRTDNRHSDSPAHIGLQFPGVPLRAECSMLCGDRCQLSIKQV